MSALTKFFFRAPYSSQTTWSVIRWWEARRLAYNLSIGAAGVLSLAVVAVADILPPLPRNPWIPSVGILVYAVLAKVVSLKL